MKWAEGPCGVGCASPERFRLVSEAQKLLGPEGATVLDLKPETSTQFSVQKGYSLSRTELLV